MLPSNQSSSIQKRRMLHRRQQSLEVPILATSFPTNPRRTQSGRSGHRRGLSLDQSLSVLQSFPGFRPPQLQDTNSPGFTIGPSARTHPDTNIGQQRQLLPDQQHLIKQETQEHSLAQPGFAAAPQAHDFQSHLHQQLNGLINTPIASSSPDQATAMQNLQEHMAWYAENYGPGAVGTSMQTQSFAQDSLAGNVDSAMYSMPQPMMFNLNQQPHTVPNTPQNYSAGWPSPPPSKIKMARSQSYQLDVAPMPHGLPNSALGTSTEYRSDGSFASHGDHEYTASEYSSSVADASSPPQQHNSPMPTLYEEPSSSPSDDLTAGDLLLQVATGAESDFNSPHFVIGGSSVCAEQAALDAAGIDATYIDNGITDEHINSYLVNPAKKGDAYICTYQGCGTKVNRKENARAHVQNHLDDRKYQCNVCDKRFTRSHDTKRHAMTHTNARPAICPCGRSFARADALTRHRQRDMCVGVLPGFEKDPEDKPKRGRPKKDRSMSISEVGSKRTIRPDMDVRTQKAAHARAIDRAYGSNAHNVGRAGSASSDNSLPDTPPHDDDSMSAHDFLNMDVNHQLNHGHNTWLDTPPTSPASMSISKAAMIDLTRDDCVSPSKLSTHSSPAAMTGAVNDDNLLRDCSSPVPFHSAGGMHGGSSPIDPAIDIFNDTVNFDVMNSHPEVGHDVFSPPGESCSNSSVYNSDFDVVPVARSKVKFGLPTIYDERRTPDKQSFDDPFSDGLDDFAMAPPSDQFGEFKDFLLLDGWLAHN